MNIRFRLTLWYTAIFSLILLIFSLVVYVGLARNMLNTIDNHLQREVGEILGNLEFHSTTDGDSDSDYENDELGDSVTGAPGITLSYVPEEGVYWRVLDSSGQPLIDPGHFKNISFETNVTNLSHAVLENTTLGSDTPIRLYSAPFVIENRGAGVVQVGESYRHLQEVQNQLLLLLAVGVPLTMLASGAGGWFLAANALDPIDRITRTAHQISARDLHQRLQLNLPNDEVGRLASTFDQMLERLENAFEQQRRFIADASHEMKTPLTILKGDVEVALTRPRSPEYYVETLEMVNSTTDRLIALVQELLLLARSESDQSPLNMERLNLADLLSLEASRLMPKAVSKNIELHLDLPNVLLIHGDQAKLQRLFLNLIDNAVKYSSPGSSVTVAAMVYAQEVCVSISDTGPGIPPEHLPHLFERFYRVDKARAHSSSNGTSSGAGLGLSIVRWLVQAHQGRIEVESKVGQGTTFKVWLPMTKSRFKPEPLQLEGES